MTSKIDPALFDDGRPVRKSDLRDTFGQIRSEIDHGGYYRPAVDGARARPVADRLADMLSVKDFGAVGDGGTDDSAAFQAAIDTGRAIYVPAGKYKIRTALKIRPGQPFHLVGEYKKNPTAAWLIHDPDDPDTDEPLIHREEGWLGANGAYTDGYGNVPDFRGHASIILKNLKLGSTHGKYAQCLDTVGGVNSVIEECKFAGTMRCVTFGPSSFDVSFLNCRASNTNWHKFYDMNDPDDSDQITHRNWVYYSESHSYFFNCNVGGGTIGLYLTGFGNVVLGGRIENARHSIVLGKNRFGLNGSEVYMAHATTITGVRIEAPQIGIICHAVKASSLRDISIQGSPPHSIRPYEGEVGVWLKDYFDPNSRIENILVHNDFAIAGIVNETTTPIWSDRSGVNGGVAVGSQNLALMENSHKRAGPSYHFLNTQMFPMAVNDTHRTLTAFHDLMLRGLTGLNIRDRATQGPAEGGPVFARNLGGSERPAAGSASVDVTFPGGLITNGVAFPSDGVSLVDSPNSTLEPGTYWYATTVVSDLGETAATGDAVAVADAAAGQAVRCGFYGAPKEARRRIYRGREKDIYDGYWEFDTHETFVDDGSRPFDGRGLPPMRKGYNVPSRVEDDANYQIVVTPSWHTTAVVRNKETTGFTIEFGTPPPDDGQTVAWLLFRP